MNIFNKKLQESSSDGLPLDPIELYQTCPYKESYGYLRGIQEEVLKEWHKRRDQKDVICKMNTGSGKTLTGLLMLYSKIGELKQPALYVCPDGQLVDQTIELAENYGIPVCTFDSKNPSQFPTDFLNAKKILVCNFHKLFNGKTIFNREHIELGAVLLDDAHKCVDIARSQTSIRLSRSQPVVKKIFKLFEKALKHQLPGTFQRLSDGDPEMLMKVPYWSWLDENEKVIAFLTELVDEAKDDQEKEKRDKDTKDGIIFKWNFLADNLLTYDCFIGGQEIEISPIHVPYQYVTSFHEAKHRFILSATFEDDFDLIRDLGISFESIINPIVPKDRKDVGKRLILAPSRIDPMLEDITIRKFISGYVNKGYNVVVLVPSSEKSKNWAKHGALVVDTNNIETGLEKLKSSVGNFIVFINRYDGLDLFGDQCRVLVVDGLPRYTSLRELYSETRVDSLSVGKKAQIIEQGLGRGVRSGSDYCVVYLLGRDLERFVAVDRNLEHFTPITRAQLNLGLKLLDGTEEALALKTIEETAALCLAQNTDWIQYHSKELLITQSDEIDDHKIQRLKLAEIEKLALKEFSKRNYQDSGNLVLDGISQMKLTDKENAWYFQLAAQLTYLGDKVISNDLQTKSCEFYGNMLHPPQGFVYSKMSKKGSQASMVKARLSEFGLQQDIVIFINDIVNGLEFNPDINANIFEQSLQELGDFLGFASQRPEKELGVGPDVLWCLSDGHFLILEAKSQRIGGEIAKGDIEQLQQSELWLKESYGADVEYSAVTLQPISKKAKGVFIGKLHKVIDKDSLSLLCNQLLQFGKALQKAHPKSHSEESISKLLNAYSLTPTTFRQTFIKSII